jgi:hypothetical protein
MLEVETPIVKLFFIQGIVRIVCEEQISHSTATTRGNFQVINSDILINVCVKSKRQPEVES